MIKNQSIFLQYLNYLFLKLKNNLRKVLAIDIAPNGPSVSVGES